MRVTAKLNHLHMSPRKVRAVVGAVKRFTAVEALEKLRLIPRRSAQPLIKLLKSAIANAEHNFALSAEGLKIAVFKVDGGPVLKRFRPGSKGRVSPIAKRTAHVTVVLEGDRRAVRPVKETKADVIKTISAEEKEKVDIRPESKKSPILKGKAPAPKGPGFVKRFFRRKSV